MCIRDRVVALAAKDAYDFLGSPEGELAVAHACLYLATAPKSNRAYMAEKAAKKLARESGSVPPPKNIVNAPTRLMQQLGHGANYHYDHDSAHGFSGDNYWPQGMVRQTLYQPTDRGMEKRIGERLALWDELRKAKR